MKNFLIVLVGFSLGLGFVFLVVSGIYWVVAWAFDLTFSWKYSVGISVIWILLSQLFKSARTPRVKTIDEKWDEAMRRK